MDLVNCVNDRSVVMEKDERDLIEILKQFGKVVDYMTQSMAADFFKVDETVIEWHGTKNKNELSKYGYKVYKKSEILNIEGLHLENIPNRGLRLYPIKAVLVIGMLLTESEVAEQLRCKILGVKQIGCERKEIKFLNQLEESLKPFNIKGVKQYLVSSYRIDYYIPSLNIAIEYDENEHKHYAYKEHEGRQIEIEKELNCKFIRVSDKNTNEYNIGYVIKNIFNL